MEEGRLKQRLVGAVVLVALAVIFIPMLLSGGREMEMPVFGSNVPQRSEAVSSIQHIEVNDKQEPVSPVNPKRIPIASNMPEPKNVKEKSSGYIVDKIVELTKEYNKNSVSKNNVWAVQVGSFAKKENALGLKDKLRKKNIHAFVERIMKNNKAVYRVRVGPEISLNKAKILKSKLKKEFNLNGIVVKHP